MRRDHYPHIEMDFAVVACSCSSVVLSVLSPSASFRPSNFCPSVRTKSREIAPISVHPLMKPNRESIFGCSDRAGRAVYEQSQNRRNISTPPSPQKFEDRKLASAAAAAAVAVRVRSYVIRFFSMGAAVVCSLVLVQSSCD